MPNFVISPGSLFGRIGVINFRQKIGKKLSRNLGEIVEKIWKQKLGRNLDKN